MKRTGCAFLESSPTSLVTGRFGVGWLFAAALVPGILAGSLLLYEIYQSERAQLEQGALHTAHALSQVVDRDLAGIHGKLNVLAMSPALRANDLPTFYRQANEVLATEPLAEAVVLIDPSGQQLMNTIRPLGTQLPKSGHPNLLDRDFSPNDPMVSDLFVGGASGRYFVTVEVPIWRDGKIVSGLDMGIPAERLNRILLAQHLPPDWVASLLDSHGSVVARSRNAARFVGRKASPDLLAQMGKGDEGSLASRMLEGGPSYVAFSRSAPSGWTVTVGMNRDVLYESLYGPLALTALVIAAFIVASGALIVLFSQYIRKALQSLGNAADAAAAGNMEVMAPLAGPREIRRLAAQFNHMQVARKLAKQKLQLAASVFSETSEGITIADRHARIIDVNRAFTELTGYARSEVVGKNPRLLQSGHHGAAFYADMWQSLKQYGRWRGEIWNRRKDGSLFVEQMNLTVVKDANGAVSHYIGLFSDVTEHRQQQDEVEHLAYHDPLTQLPNRRLLSDRIHQMLSNADRQQTLIALCCLDLDGFKPINDTYGHHAGDRVLVEIARRLQDAVRPHDTVARLGGDEFVLLLTNLHSRAESDVVLARILQAVAEPIALGNELLVRVTASIGVTLYPNDGRDPDQLLQNGDQAMYLAKVTGRNRVHWFESNRDQPAR